ncbi:hypothetical protein [Herbiconiux sp. YIM B11900]|uniref:hypothetical protein n=1 Tax=Herbiconiux sp. YIM B11900 TaxID=3404131 RepID=UPI003F850C79
MGDRLESGRGRDWLDRMAPVGDGSYREGAGRILVTVTGAGFALAGVHVLRHTKKDYR